MKANQMIIVSSTQAVLLLLLLVQERRQIKSMISTHLTRYFEENSYKFVQALTPLKIAKFGYHKSIPLAFFVSFIRKNIIASIPLELNSSVFLCEKYKNATIC